MFSAATDAEIVAPDSNAGAGWSASIVSPDGNETTLRTHAPRSTLFSTVAAGVLAPARVTASGRNAAHTSPDVDVEFGKEIAPSAVRSVPPCNVPGKINVGSDQCGIGSTHNSIR
jgi:hypothetical protein